MHNAVLAFVYSWKQLLPAAVNLSAPADIILLCNTQDLIVNKARFLCIDMFLTAFTV